MNLPFGFLQGFEGRKPLRVRETGSENRELAEGRSELISVRVGAAWEYHPSGLYQGVPYPCQARSWKSGHSASAS